MPTHQAIRKAEHTWEEDCAKKVNGISAKRPDKEQICIRGIVTFQQQLSKSAIYEKKCVLGVSLYGSISLD